MDWWSLPGPGSFLSEVVEALRDGQNLVLAKPLNAAVGLSTALEQKLHDEGWRLAGHVNADASDPVDRLFSSLDLDDCGAQRRSIALLRQCLGAGVIVLVSGVGSAVWPVWKRFLTEYEVASRSVLCFDRPLLIVVTEGVAASDLPPRAAALKIFQWKNVVGELDMLLYVNQVFRSRGKLDFASRHVARMISRLALWDFALADHLLDQRPDDLFQPAVMIRSACEALGHPVGMTRSWDSGGLQCLDDIELAHPFLLASQGDPHADLIMRIWSAQATEILPALEIHRRELARRMKPMVSVPFQMGEDQIIDLDDLEIGQLAYVAHTRRLSSAIQQKAEKWRRLRNKLAHLEPLDASEALDCEIFRSSQNRSHISYIRES